MKLSIMNILNNIIVINVIIRVGILRVRRPNLKLKNEM